MQTHVKSHGVILFLSALFIFAISDATAKYLAVFFAVPLLAWARYVLHLLFMLVVTVPRTGRKIIVTQRPGLMILRALMQVFSTVLVLLAYRTLPLAETTALVFLTPVLVALLSGPLLGEKVGVKGWLATLAGLSGALLIARPGSAVFGVGVFYALGAAFCYAIYQLLTRKLSTTEPAIRQLFYIALTGSIVMSFALPAYWTGTLPSLMQGLLIASLGLYGGTGQFLLIRAFHETPASTLSPLLYFQLVWAIILGWLVFGHLPDLLTVLGMLVIGVAGLLLALRWPRGAA